MLQDVPTMLGGRYRVVERLGRGGMADVYRAEDVVLRRTVAIKVFRGGVEREQHLARFRTEVRTLAALTHPNLVALYDAGGDVAEPWCAMEYVDGGSLADREGALSPAVVAKIGEQIAGGLGYVHGRGIVHRDVKPSNVLLGSGGDAFLSDFGIAKLVDGTRMTQSGLMIGTAAFLSPEQVRGRTAGPASDVYALGLVLLEALTGRREYPGTPVESAVARLSRPPEVPAEFAADWADLLNAMTVEDAAERPAPSEVESRLHVLAQRLAAPVTPGPGTPAPVAPAEPSAVARVEAPRVEAALVEAPPETPLDRAGGDPPRNLLGWLSPERRRRIVAGLVGVGAVVAVAVATSLVDGSRTGPVRIDSASDAGQTATGAPPAAVAGIDPQLQVRKAPVADAPLPEEDRPVSRATAGAAVANDGRRPVVGGVATTRAARPTPTPTLTTTSLSPSPTTSSPSPSSPSPSASPSASASASGSGAPTTGPGSGVTPSPSGTPSIPSGSGSSGTPSSIVTGGTVLPGGPVTGSGVASTSLGSGTGSNAAGSSPAGTSRSGSPS